MFCQIVNLTYSAEDWFTMQTAHQMASVLLQRDPTTHEHADRLARCVMKLFAQGIRDANEIAIKAAEHEASVSVIGDKRDSIAS